MMSSKSYPRRPNIGIHTQFVLLSDGLYLLAIDQFSQYPEVTGKLDATLFTDEVNI